MKLTDELKIVDEYMSNLKGSTELAREYGDYRDLRRMLQRARIHGAETILHANCRQDHPLEFKLEVVRYILNGAPYGEATAKYNLYRALVKAWHPHKAPATPVRPYPLPFHQISPSTLHCLYTLRVSQIIGL